MTRPLRLDFACAVYRVTSREDRREDIYLDDNDRQAWMAVLSLVCDRFNGVVHSFYQMTNLCYLLVDTIDGNLSADRNEAMAQAYQSGTYTMAAIALQVTKSLLDKMNDANTDPRR